MKHKKLFLLIVILLSSCKTVKILPPSTPTLQPGALLSTMEVSDITPTTGKLDPSKGGIQGNVTWAGSNEPVKTVNIELNGHSGDKPPRYTVKVDSNGNYEFVNIEPINYGFGVYFSIPISERRCDVPEFTYDQDYGWLHYTTWLKGDLYFDIIFSGRDVKVEPGETVVLNFALKCP